VKVPGIFEPVDNRRYNNMFKFLETIAPEKSNSRYNINILRSEITHQQHQRQHMKIPVKRHF
jgi:hypothetical protein